MDIEENFKLIEGFLNEGKGYIEKGDPIQASEKLYKVVEECVKFLGEKYSLPEYKEAQREGRWWSRLLTRGARRLARDLNERRIEEVWAVSFDLHTWGFHERSLEIEDVKQDIPYVEWFLNYTKQIANLPF